VPHQQVWDHNKIKLLDVNQSYPIAKLSAISKGVHANSMESDRADGLQKIIFLCKMMILNFAIEIFAAILPEQVLSYIL
jgi:hypothetical protein